MSIRYLLFDVDDTLLDFQATEKSALRKLFAEQGLPFTSELEQIYKRINHQLWRDHEAGKLERGELLNSRFGLFFKEFQQEVDSPLLEQHYRRYLNEGHDLIIGSQEMLAQLQADYELYVVTNGTAETQYRRLTDAKLLDYFKDIFISEELGAQKPMLAFFDQVFDKIPQFRSEQAVIIGDSLSSDIQGGKNAGIKTIWFNPSDQLAAPQLAPNYQISQLDQIYHALEELDA